MTATTATTKRDVISAAMGLAEDVADGKLNPAALEAQAVAELRALVGTVAGPDDPLWPIQHDIARQVIALDGIPADELAEWLAVARQRAGQADLPLDPPPPVSLPSVALSPDSAGAELADADALADAEPGPVAPELADPQPPTPPRRADGYDALAGWSPSRSLLLD
jgi:hypothetical protein